jgi:hypothetical protein
MIKLQTMFFTFAVAVYAGVTAAVTFAASVHFAFGWVLGQLFLWAAWVAFISWVITRAGLQREAAWWDARREGEGGALVGGEKRREGEGKGEGKRRVVVGEKAAKGKGDPEGSGAAGKGHGDDPAATVEEKQQD